MHAVVHVCALLHARRALGSVCAFNPFVVQVKSAALALQVALNRLMMKSVGRSVAQGRLYGVFEFMDSDR